MGLDITVGFLVDLAEHDPEEVDDVRADFAVVNEVLADNGLPTYEEPVAAEWEPFAVQMYGYSGLHYLRRIAAHLAAGRPLPPPGDDDASDDEVLAAYYGERGFRRLFRRGPSYEFDGRFEHLIKHSDAEGFYVPVEFGAVIYDDRIVGTMLGSSHALAHECAELARTLGIPDLDPESEELWDAADEPGAGPEQWQRYGIESFTCARLLAAARLSVERGAAVVFH